MTALPHAAAKFDTRFYRTTSKLALPVVLQNLISIGLNMLDTMMIGKLGVSELAGVGAANRVYFIFIICCFGFISGTTIILSQYWGVRDLAQIRRILGVDYAFALALSLLTMATAYLLAPQLIGLFADDAAVVDFGARYLRLVQFSYLFTACSVVISFNSRAVHRVVMPTVINAAALAANTFLNYCLIYGNFGFAARGVEGAALATIAARTMEFALMLLYVYGAKGHPLAGRLRELAAWDRGLLRRLMSKALPTTASELAWSLGNVAYYAAYGKIGAASLAVAQVCSVVNDLFQSIFYGLGNASAVMIGNELGRKNTARVYEYAWRFLRIASALCLAMCGLYLLSRGWIVSFYDFDPETSRLLYQTMLTFSLFLIPRMLTFTMLIGILRAGGDTHYTLIVDMAGVWLLGVPLAFIGALLLQWSLPLVVALSLVEEAIKLFVFLARIKSKKWLNVLI